MTARVDIDGFFVIQDYVQESEGKVTYRGHGILSWDDPRRNFIWYWVDAMGLVPPVPARGDWKGDTLVFEAKDAAGTRHARYTHRVTGKDGYFFKIENSQDGGKTWGTFMEADYKRVP